MNMYEVLRIPNLNADPVHAGLHSNPDWDQLRIRIQPERVYPKYFELFKLKNSNRTVYSFTFYLASETTLRVRFDDIKNVLL